MREATASLALLLSCLAFGACGPRPEPRPAEAEGRTERPRADQDAADEDKRDSDGAASADEDEAPPAKPEPEQAKAETVSPPKNGIADVCKKLNQRVAQKCSKKIAELYDSSCKHYLKKPDSCEKQIVTALECQYKAADEPLCAHEADPKCIQVNRELKSCQTGAAPVDQNTAEDTTVPSDWEEIHDQKLGFKVALPRGAALDEKAKHRTWQAEEASISYYVAALDPPAGKLNNQTYVRTVVAYVGAKCQRKLKLNGELDIKGTTVVQYHSACPDGSEWHGMLHFWSGKLVSTGYHAPAGATGVQEPYFYSFQITK